MKIYSPVTNFCLDINRILSHPRMANHIRFGALYLNRQKKYTNDKMRIYGIINGLFKNFLKI